MKQITHFIHLIIINYYFCFGHEFTCFHCMLHAALWLKLELQWVVRWKAAESAGWCCSWHSDTHLSRKISRNRSYEPWCGVRVRWLVCYSAALALQTNSTPHLHYKIPSLNCSSSCSGLVWCNVTGMFMMINCAVMQLKAYRGVKKKKMTGFLNLMVEITFKVV